MHDWCIQKLLCYSATTLPNYPIDSSQVHAFWKSAERVCRHRAPCGGSPLTDSCSTYWLVTLSQSLAFRSEANRDDCCITALHPIPAAIGA